MSKLNLLGAIFVLGIDRC